MATSDLHKFVEWLMTIYHIRSGKSGGALPFFLKSGGALAPPAPSSVPPLHNQAHLSQWRLQGGSGVSGN